MMQVHSIILNSGLFEKYIFMVFAGPSSWKQDRLDLQTRATLRDKVQVHKLSGTEARRKVPTERYV